MIEKYSKKTITNDGLQMVLWCASPFVYTKQTKSHQNEWNNRWNRTNRRRGNDCNRTIFCCCIFCHDCVFNFNFLPVLVLSINTHTHTCADWLTEKRTVLHQCSASNLLSCMRLTFKYDDVTTTETVLFIIFNWLVMYYSLVYIFIGRSIDANRQNDDTLNNDK